MKKIYSETVEKSGTCQFNSPCVRVELYVPTEGELELPAIILLKRGKISVLGDYVFSSTYDLVESDQNWNEPYLIRKAIGSFDRLKESWFKEFESSDEES